MIEWYKRVNWVGEKLGRWSNRGFGDGRESFWYCNFCERFVDVNGQNYDAENLVYKHYEDNHQAFVIMVTLRQESDMAQ